MKPRKQGVDWVAGLVVFFSGCGISTRIIETPLVDDDASAGASDEGKGGSSAGRGGDAQGGEDAGTSPGGEAGMGGSGGNAGAGDAGDGGDDGSGGSDAECGVGDRECFGGGVRVCDGGLWSAPRACAGQACVDGVCVGVCRPGVARCAGNSTMTCTLAGGWGAAVACPVERPLCGAGTCRVPRSPTTLAVIPAHVGVPRGLAVDSTHLYASTQHPTSSVILKMDLASDLPPYVIAADQPEAIGLAIDEKNAYFPTWGDGTVMKVPLTGGAAVPIASGQAGPHNIATDGEHVYWPNRAGDAVMRVSVARGIPEVFAAGQPTPYVVALDSSNVFWVNEANGSVMRCPKSSDMPMPLVGGGLPGPAGLAVDATSVYYTNYTDGIAAKVPIGGGQPLLLATGLIEPFTISTDETSVYIGSLLGLQMLSKDGSALTMLDPAGYIGAVVVTDVAIYYTSADALKKIVR